MVKSDFSMATHVKLGHLRTSGMVDVFAEGIHLDIEYKTTFKGLTLLKTNIRLNLK